MNNSDINIAEILRDCPAGTPLYSRITGKLELQQVLEKGCDRYPIQAEVIYEDEDLENDKFASFTDTGRWNYFLPNGDVSSSPPSKCRTGPSSSEAATWSSAKH